MAGLREFLQSFGGEENIELGVHPDDEPLLSSVNDVREVEDTHVWRDIEQLIDDRIENLQQALTRADDPVKIRRIQGAITAWQDFKDIPDTLVRYIQMQNEEQQNGQRSRTN